MSHENIPTIQIEILPIKLETKCPFVSEQGPSCPSCGADPTKVNLDPADGTGFCDDCGHRFRISKKKYR